MRLPRLLLVAPCAVLAAMVAIALAAMPAAEADGGGVGWKVIVNPANTIGAVDRAFLKDAFLRKRREWSNGSAIRPIDLSTRFPVRERYVREVLRKTPAQLKSYWNQQIFSGKGTPPPEGRSVAAVIAYVLEHPGAVAYLPADADPGRAKVIEVR